MSIEANNKRTVAGLTETAMIVMGVTSRKVHAGDLKSDLGSRHNEPNGSFRGGQS